MGNGRWSRRKTLSEQALHIRFGLALRKIVGWYLCYPSGKLSSDSCALSERKCGHLMLERLLG